MVGRVGLVLVCVLVCFSGSSLLAQEQGGGLSANNMPLSAASFGFDCVYNTSCGATWDGGYWISTTSQPGLVRLWESGTTWADLETGNNSFDWSHLDTWLDMVAENQPRAIMYTFGRVPCFIINQGLGNNNCEHTKPEPSSAAPPRDLTGSGSPTFNAFVRALVHHCSPAGHCVKDYIQYWELWNEANIPAFWLGTPIQLYNMMKPAVKIIRENIPNAMVTTPPVCGSEELWMEYWLNLENTYGRLSDIYDFHLYMLDSEPEERISYIEKMVDAKNKQGWTTTPWMNGETNWDNLTFQCSSNYSQDDCNGQVVRWFVMQYAYQGGGGGAVQIGWFNWPSMTNYDPYYYTMMQWLVGSTFTVSCSTSGNVWTCPVTESNGVSALIVWNGKGHAHYRPADQYVDYKEMDGTYGGQTVQISPGQTTTIGYIPIMFESAP